jgi:hypothetical protein
MIYVAISVTMAAAIVASPPPRRKAGMSEAMFGELMAVVGMANETNRLANATGCRWMRRSNHSDRGAVGRRSHGVLSRSRSGF